MKVSIFILIPFIVFGCTVKNASEKRILDGIAAIDSIATVDSLAIADSIQQQEMTRQVMADMWKLGDPEAQSGAYKLEIVDDTIVVHKVDYDALSFAFPGGQEYLSEDKIIGFGDDTWTSGGTYTFEVMREECETEMINSKIDGFDSTYVKEINGLQFTIATGGVGGRDETNYYVCYRTHANNCMFFFMQVRQSGGGMDDYPTLVTEFENFIGSIKFR